MKTRAGMPEQPWRINGLGMAGTGAARKAAGGRKAAVWR